MPLIQNSPPALVSIPQILLATFVLMTGLHCSNGYAASLNARQQVTVQWITSDSPYPDRVACCPKIEEFTGPGVQDIGPGIGGNPIWVQLPALDAGTILTVDPLADAVMLFEQSATDSSWVRSVSGDSVDRSGSALPVPKIAFSLKPEQSRRLLLLDNPISARVTVSAWDREYFFQHHREQQLLTMMLIGFLAATMLFNLAISVISRDVLFLLNAICVAAMLTISLYLNMYGVTYLWPPKLSNHVLNMMLMMVILFGTAFFRQFVASKGHDPFRRFTWFSWAAMLLFVSSLFAPYWLVQTLLLVTVGAFLLSAIAVTIYTAMRGNRRSTLLLIPYLGVLVPGFTIVFLGTIDALPFTQFREQLTLITLAFEALAFSLVLGGRIRIHAAEATEAREALANERVNAANLLSQVQDQERERIASDLHDSIGHELVIVRTQLERKAHETQMENEFNPIIQGLDATLNQVRTLSHTLHPAMVSHLGFNKSVTALFEQLAASEQLDLNLQLPQTEPNLKRRDAAQIYRILQEIATNIARHAKATSCDVQVTVKSGLMTIRVADDGESRQPPVTDDWGLGLRSIEHRVSVLNGFLEMRPNRPSGLVTRIECHV